ncbi:MAG: NAD(P)-dependent alcohol dehydrogenase [Pseudomonadota bacterium]
MKAVTYRCYGSPDVLQYGDVAMPAIADDQLLVRVHAAGVNPLDWHYMRGTPYIMRAESGFGKPSDPRLGVDFAGTVEAVGKNVTRFKPGDSVFGGAAGAFAEYVRVRESGAVALMPENVSFDEAGTVAIAALTALQGLRDKGGLEAGQRVLINGASGGVGTFAVQIAKAMGAEVTGVCSTRNVEMVRALGADHVIDYKKQNFTETGKTYDLILDNVGSQSLGDTRRALEADGTLVLVGSTSSGNWLGPLMRPLQAYVTSPFVSENLIMLLAVLNREDLETLAAMMRSDEVTPVIDRRYALSDVADAIRYSETGRARGKIVIDVL